MRFIWIDLALPASTLSCDHAEVATLPVQGQGRSTLQVPKLSEQEWYKDHEHYCNAPGPDLNSTEDMLKWLQATRKPMEQCFDWLEKTVREFDERMDLRIKTFYGPGRLLRKDVTSAESSSQCSIRCYSCHCPYNTATLTGADL